MEKGRTASLAVLPFSLLYSNEGITLTRDTALLIEQTGQDCGTNLWYSFMKNDCETMNKNKLMEEN
jgi:hypothetical protein